VCGLAEAGHVEYHPDAALPLIVPVTCPAEGWTGDGPKLSGGMTIGIASDSRVSRIYGQQRIKEGFNCSYELNPAFEEVLEARGLRVVGRGERNEARIVELADHRFFIATLFQPQLASAPGAPHPLIAAYLKAVQAFRKERKTD
jgi:CTP synthase (UTP-ammonia lyase)